MNNIELYQQLETYKSKQPEIVFEWNDPLTDARGWVVINSLRGGAAGGGTRMRKGLTKDEVVSLAKVMEIKFGVCGPDIGGAKSGIDFDPEDPRRSDVLKRWFAAVFPILKNYYGTGGDLNVDELKDVIPITEDLGLWHPQEGIVNGHFNANKGEMINLIGQLRYGCAKIVEDPRYAPVKQGKFAIADMITGFGVAESIKHYYKIFKAQNLKGKRVIVQGWGNVASAAGYYLSKSEANIVGIIDRRGGIIDAEGISSGKVEELFVNKNGNEIAGDIIPFDEVNKKIWDVPADIFVPGAASKIVTQDQVNRMINNGLKVISCGANVPFSDDGIFFGKTAAKTDELIAVIPDFVANCGMARVFAYLMDKNAEMTDEAIFEDVSSVIEHFIYKVFCLDKTGELITQKSLSLILKKLLQ
jgi:glutamate dehydrogenase/leucine dehydrogenase